MEYRQYVARESDVINVLYTLQEIDWFFRSCISLAIAFAQFECQFNHRFPGDLLLQLTQLYCFNFPKALVKDPLKGAMLIFTGGFSND